MRRIPLQLADRDRRVVEEVRHHGLHQAREVNRAHVLSGLDRGLPEAQIAAVLGISRSMLARTRQAYLQQGLSGALLDARRPGRPCRYGTQALAWLLALAASPPPEGRHCWSLRLLQQAARRQPGLDRLGRETVRRLLRQAAGGKDAAG